MPGSSPATAGPEKSGDIQKSCARAAPPSVAAASAAAMAAILAPERNAIALFSQTPAYQPARGPRRVRRRVALADRDVVNHDP